MTTQAWPHPPSRVAKLEFLVVQGAVLLGPYVAIRHPDVFITISDCLFLVALLLRIGVGIPVAPLGPLTGLWLLGALMLTGGLFVSSLMNGDLLRCLIVDAQYLFAYICLPYVLLSRPMDQVVRLVKCGMLAMFTMCAIGIGFYLSGHNGGTARHLAIVTGGQRLAGFVDNANGMAGYIILALPLLWFLWRTGHVRPLAAMICLVVMLVGLVLTSSNTGLFGLVAVTVILFGGGRNLTGLALATALAYSLLTWGQPYLPHVFQERVLNAISNEDISQAGTYEGRRKLAVEAWAMAEDHVGIGLGADRYRAISKYDLPVHNTYLLLLNEGGFISLAGLLLLFGCAVLTPFMMRGMPGGDVVLLTTVAVTVVLAGMSMGFTHIYARSLILPVLLAISPALSSTLAFRPPARRVDRRPAGPRRPAGGIAG